jgi:hypothetical protein
MAERVRAFAHFAPLLWRADQPVRDRAMVQAHFAYAVKTAPTDGDI